MQPHLWSSYKLSQNSCYGSWQQRTDLPWRKCNQPSRPLQIPCSMVRIDGDSTPEICARLAIARDATSQLIGLWKAKEISLKLKKQLVKSLVWSIALYGAESWTLKQSEMKKIESFELWVWRRMLQVDQKDRKTNVWIRQRVEVSEEEGLLAQLRKRKLSMYGHWKRRSDSLVQMNVEGEVEGKARTQENRLD